jgi:hypothetical protein
VAVVVARLLLLELITLLALVVAQAAVRLHITVPIALAALVQLIKVTLVEIQTIQVLTTQALVAVAQVQLVRQTQVLMVEMAVTVFPHL